MISFFLMLLDSDGDRELLRRLYQENKLKLYRVALCILHDKFDAQDCLHDAIIRIILNFEKIKRIPCEKMVGYIVIIVANQAKNQRKKKRPTVELNEDLMLPDISPGQEDKTGYNYLVALIKGMTDTYREVLYFKCVLEWNEQDIAQVMKLSLTAVSTRISRGRAILIQKLTEEGYYHDRARV